MTEIEKELNRRADIIIRQEKQIQIDAEQIRALQKQNGELTDKVRELGKQLEKENAVQREQINILDNCDRLSDVITEAYKEQLTKAKKLLKNLLSAYTSYADSFDDRDNEIVSETEQFISEVEK